MKTPSAPAFRPPSGLRLVESSPRGFTLRAPGLEGGVTALAPDLFRIRLVPAGTAPAASWAVVRTDWSDVSGDVRRRGNTVRLATSAATLQFSLRDGSWRLEDSRGLEVFRARPGSVGFAGPEARLDLQLADGESLFGLGETTGQFNKRGLVREFWNIDVLGHAPAIHPSMRNLYVSIPFAVSLRDGRAGGLFWDNPGRQVWDLGQTERDRWRLSAATGGIDLYLFTGPGVPGVMERYTELTGAMPLPPRWALGYQQCRYSYETGRRVEQVAREFRRRKLPCDVLYLDIHHMDAYRVFTFGETFPRPAALLRRLARQGFKVVTIVDPGVKDDRRFGVLQRGRKADAFVKDPAGKQDFLGEVWPGRARFPDFLRESTRRWWGDEQAALLRAGVAGFWNDMNEPANFARPDKTLDPACQHRPESGVRPHAEVHNVYGMQMARASREGARRHAPDRRPYVITRSTYAGGQRDALVWTGDNSSCWEHLNDAVQMFLNLGLSGVAHCGGDVGGFLDNTTPELFTRWFQFATFTPFFRNHSNLGTIDQEPWAFGPGVEEICRRYLNLRYQLLPLLYGLFAGARETGAPILRPLLWHYPNDPVAVACGDEFLLGRDLLVAPILRQGATARSVYLPNDVWYDFWTGALVEGGGHHVAAGPPDTIPVYVRGGAILPFGPSRPFIDPTPDDTITLQVWPGAAGELAWYEDDGTSNDYEQGVASRRTLRTRTQGNRLRLEIGAPAGGFASAVRTWRLLLRHARKAAPVRVNGRPVPSDFHPEHGLVVADLPAAGTLQTVEFNGL